MAVFYVYEHRTKDTDEVFYIGKGSGKRSHFLYDRNEYHQRIVAKHGCVISILHTNLTEEEAFQLEHKLIVEHKSKGLCKANLCDGGKGGFRGGLQSLETRQKRRESMIGKHAEEKNGMFGKVGKAHAGSKPVRATRENEELIFESASLAEKALKVPSVREYASGRRKNQTHRKSGWTFNYIEGGE